MMTVIIPSWFPELATQTVTYMISHSYEDTYYMVVGCSIDVGSPRVTCVINKTRLGMIAGMMLGGRVLQESDYVAFAHDDLDILRAGWDLEVMNFFRDHPECGMVGFGGARELGDSLLYKRPYQLQQLARHDFFSNLIDWETHGQRLLDPMRVAVLDGFFQAFPLSTYREMGGWEGALKAGLSFHMYDIWAACMMARLQKEVWALPIQCQHYGGRTSISDEYREWLTGQGVKDDSVIHTKAHEIIYSHFRPELPIQVPR